jgi:creatinine amidohydrolase
LNQVFKENESERVYFPFIRKEASVSKKVMLEEMSWTEIDELSNNVDTVLVPAGSVEMEGPHLPLAVDSIVALEVAKRVAQSAESMVVAPVVNVTYSDWHMKFPGTLTLSLPTLIQVLKEVCESLITHGFRRIFFVNSHVGNDPAIWTIGNEMATKAQARVGAISLWPLATEVAKEVPELSEKKFLHAGEIMTSVTMAIRPDLVDMSKARKEYLKPKVDSFKQALSSKVEFKGRIVSVFHTSDEVTQSGVMGDPTAATAEKGEKIIGLWVEYIGEFLKEFRKIPIGN